MLKIEKEYKKEYGEISKDYLTRFNQLLNTMDLSKSKKKLSDEVLRIVNIKWKKISYTIYLVPKAAPRPRTHGQMFYVHGSRENRIIFERYMRDQDIPLITTPCKFLCRTYYPIPKSMSNIEKLLAEFGMVRPISKPDFDNVAKAYCDMCQGFLIYDDAQVVEGVSEKYYSTKPRIEIEIEYMEDYDCDYNRKKIKKKG